MRHCHYMSPGLLHALGTAMSLLNWYKMACLGDILRRLIRMTFISMLSGYVQSGSHKHFHWWSIVVLTQSPTVLMFVDITGAPRLYRGYVETWVFIAASKKTKQQVLMHGHQGWNVRHGLCHIYMRYVSIWVVYSFCLFCCFSLL